METQVGLSRDQVVQFHEQGYYFPVRVLEGSEMAELRAQFDSFLDYHWRRLKDLPPNRHDEVFAETHIFLRWVYRIVSHRNVLDAVESLLGPDLLVWDTGWFTKLPGDKMYVSWHQDANYWGLHPPNVVTAWVALSESIPENGCMRVVPGSHKTRLLPQRETYAKDNALSRGQEIAVEVDGAKAVDLVLQPGEMSLHHVDIIHGSEANHSTKPRIGIAIRYITPNVVQDGVVRQLALLVRGRDDFGHFDLIDPPESDDPASNERQVECLRRMMTNIMPK